MDISACIESNGRLTIDGFKSPWNNRELWCSSLDINLIRRVLGRNIDTIIEFGSYDGGDGIKYKSSFPNAEVYSIEPSPSCYRKIKPMEKFGLHVFNYAISDEDSVTDFYETYDHNNKNYAPCGSLNKELVSTGQGASRPLEIMKPIQVKTRKISTFCKEQNIQKVDLLHVDVEGFSREVMMGLEDLKPRMIYIEVKSSTHDHSKEVDDILTKKNFSKLSSHGTDDIWLSSQQAESVLKKVEDRSDG